MIIRFLISLLAMFAVNVFAIPIGDEIKTVCGGQARMVWCQDAGEGADAGAEGRNLRLMGLDTDDGRGERCILTNLSNYAKPMLTPDGRKVIFSNRPEQNIYVVGFDGSGLKQVAFGFALAVWRDGLTETDWVYAGTIINDADSIIINIRRFRLDKPEVSENVWSKTPLNIDNFQLSADGRHACGTFPWPACGIAALPDGEWKKFGDGCWPSLSPDNNLLLWIFDGAHRNLTMFQTKTGERWIVNINNAPGIDGFEVYHPRWSNRSLVMVMTGPYKMGTGANRIRGGGRGVEIYLGKFSEDYKKIDKWIQVTHNQYADFFPDVWVETQKKTAEPAGFTRELRRDKEALPGFPGASALPSGKDMQEKTKASDDAWPISFDKLVFYWQNRSKANSFTDPADGRSIVCRAEAKGRARYGRYFEMMPSGGAFIADGGAGELLDECAASRQLGVEVLIMPMNGKLDFSGYGDGMPSSRHASGLASYSRPEVRPSPATTEIIFPIVGYTAKSGHWNFMLGQRGAELVFKLKAGNDGPDYELNLCALPRDAPSHIIVSCSSSSVACYLNGKEVFTHNAIFGGNWEKGSIVFGNELREKYDVNREAPAGWKGLIENVTLYSRWIGPEEARKKYNASTSHLVGRKSLPALSIKAELIAVPEIPDPASIAPYRRALSVSHYKIEKITDGVCSSNEVMVAQWSVLDGQVVQSAQRRRGEIYSMKLELFSDHPELEGERLIMESDRYDLPLYYEVED